MKILVKTATLCLLATLLALLATAQQGSVSSQTDSILSILPNMNDSARLSAISDLGQLHAGLQSRGRFLHMHLEEARRQGNIREEGNALQNLTTHYYSQFDNDSIFIYGEEAIRFNRQHEQYDRMFMAYTSLIRREDVQGRTIFAMRRADEALAKAKELQHIYGISEILRVISGISFRFGQYEEAIRYMTESLELFLEYQQEHYEFISFSRYDALAGYSRYVNRPLDMLRYADSIRVEIDRINRLSNINTQTFSFLEMRYRAIAHVELNQPELALEAIRSAEEIYDPAFDPGVNKFYATQLVNIWGIYHLATGNYDKAIDCLTQVVEYYESIAAGDMGLSLSYKLLAQAHAGKGDDSKATEIYQRLIEKTEERIARLFISQINELRTIYELDKAELEAERHRAKIRQQRLLNIGLILAFAAVVVIAALIAWNRKRLVEKNSGLYQQINEQDILKKDLEKERKEKREIFKRLLKYETIEISPQNAEIVAEIDAFELFSTMMNRQLLFTNSNISRKELAKKMKMSEKELSKCIKNNTNKKYTEYINDLRFDYAKKMLTSPENHKIEYVAVSSGFNSREWFHNTFKEKFKLTPDEYRNQKKNEQTTTTATTVQNIEDEE